MYKFSVLFELESINDHGQGHHSEAYLTIYNK